MKDGGSYLQSDRSGSPFQSFAKRPLFAMRRRELVARRDDCGLSTGLLFSHFDPSIRIHARSLAATHLGLVRCYRYCSKHGLKILLPFLTRTEERAVSNLTLNELRL